MCENFCVSKLLANLFTQAILYYKYNHVKSFTVFIKQQKSHNFSP